MQLGDKSSDQWGFLCCLTLNDDNNDNVSVNGVQALTDTQDDPSDLNQGTRYDITTAVLPLSVQLSGTLGFPCHSGEPCSLKVIMTTTGNPLPNLFINTRSGKWNVSWLKPEVVTTNNHPIRVDYTRCQRHPYAKFQQQNS